MWIAEHPLTITVLPDVPEDFQTSTSVLHPSTQLLLFMPKEPTVPQASIPFLGTAAGTVYVYGRIKDRDAFKQDHTTNFRLMYGGSEPARGNLLKPDYQGNKAD